MDNTFYVIRLNKKDAYYMSYTNPHNKGRKMSIIVKQDNIDNAIYFKSFEAAKRVLSAYNDLEKATIQTIEEGKMTKDLALITSIENPTVLNSEGFIKAIAETLRK